MKLSEVFDEMRYKADIDGRPAPVLVTDAHSRNVLLWALESELKGYLIPRYSIDEPVYNGIKILVDNGRKS